MFNIHVLESLKVRHKESEENYIPFCSLNLSQLSFKVLNTIAAMSLVSVVASCGNYFINQPHLKYCQGGESLLCQDGTSQLLSYS
jgi:hypothetical protein